MNRSLFMGVTVITWGSNLIKAVIISIWTVLMTIIIKLDRGQLPLPGQPRPDTPLIKIT